MCTNLACLMYLNCPPLHIVLILLIFNNSNSGVSERPISGERDFLIKLNTTDIKTHNTEQTQIYHQTSFTALYIYITIAYCEARIKLCSLQRRRCRNFHYCYYYLLLLFFAWRTPAGLYSSAVILLRRLTSSWICRASARQGCPQLWLVEWPSMFRWASRFLSVCMSSACPLWGCPDVPMSSYRPTRLRGR